MKQEHFREVHIAPQPGPQYQFLTTPADIAIYGGAAGGGKTWALLYDAVREIDKPGYNAMILRRTFPEITNQGGLWDESEAMYPSHGGVGTRGDLIWRWRLTGASVSFNHLHHENALTKYDGAQVTFIGFDQLEHFTEKMFFYLFARNRNVRCSVPGRIRATCNPDPDSFLVNFLDWWIAEDGYADMSRAGKLRYFVRINDTLYWGDSKAEMQSRFPGSEPTSVTFIPATIYDNKILLAKNPEYLARLKALPLVEQERFLGDAVRGGNWHIRPAAGKVFNRSWFELVDEVPEGGVECRGWDFAATEKSIKNDDPDFTASVKVRKVGGFFYVTDVMFDRIAAGEIDSFVRRTTDQDAMFARQSGTRYLLRWEIEPGSAGIREADRMRRDLREYNADGVSATGDKLTKWRACAVASQLGKVRVLNAPWTETFLAFLHGQPDLNHDDPVDGFSIAYNAVEPLPESTAPAKKQPTGLARRKHL